MRASTCAAALVVLLLPTLGACGSAASVTTRATSPSPSAERQPASLSSPTAWSGDGQPARSIDLSLRDDAGRWRWVATIRLRH